ncbi:hypothetical protein QZH41_014740, partial [Actinostola sp. cb2023]
MCKNHNRPWCATTANYDKDKKWTNCAHIANQTLANCQKTTKPREYCYLPFIYQGKTYNHCTCKNHNRPWCATTANYDKDKKWANCQNAKDQPLANCQKTTKAGEYCYLPFIYQSKTYNHCTCKNHNRPWCATTANYDKDKNWTNCAHIANQPLANCQKTTKPREYCYLPFIYQGKTYNHCTCKNHNRPWCATTANYDKDKNWTNCAHIASKRTI